MPSLYRSAERMLYEFVKLVLREAWNSECSQCRVRARAFCQISNAEPIMVHRARLFKGFNKALVSSMTEPGK